MAIIVFLPSVVFAVDWVSLGKPKDSSYELFIDMDSIRLVDGLVLYWERSEYSPPASGPGGKAYSTLKAKYAANCVDGSSATIQYSYFSPTGSHLHSRTFNKQEWEFDGGTPGSKGELVLDFVCKVAKAKKSSSDTSKHADDKRSKAKTGSGFVIDRGGFIVTNNHVIEGCTVFNVSHSGRTNPARLIGADEKFDLALLSVGTNLPEATLRQGVPEVGETIYVAGFPLAGMLANEMNFTEGTISSPAGIAGDISKIQITAPVQAGNSGGPLLDSSGQLIGVVVSKLNAVNVARSVGDLPQNVNFAIKVDMLRMFLDTQRVKYKVSSVVARVDSVQIAKRARAYTVQITCE